MVGTEELQKELCFPECQNKNKKQKPWASLHKIGSFCLFFFALVQVVTTF